MADLIDGLLAHHIALEKEEFHLITTLYGIVCPDSDIQTQLRIAKSLELMKVSTLLVDDFLDKSPLRNGIPSMFAQRGPEETVLMAEILKSSATLALYEAMSNLRNMSSETRLRCLALFEDTYRTVCLGQLEEIRLQNLWLSTWQIDEPRYFDMIAKTTAAFIKMPLLLAGEVRRLGRQSIARLAAVGESIGLAYQVRDDLSDLVVSRELSGKEPGGDIRERKFRLPIILLLKTAKKPTIDRFRTLYAKSSLSEGEVKEVMAMVTESGAIEATAKCVSTLCVDARAHLAGLSNRTVAAALSQVADLIEVPVV